MNTLTVLSSKNGGRFEKKNLWVKWEVELLEGVQHVKSQNFFHDQNDHMSKYGSKWKLKLAIGSKPSLSLHFKLTGWRKYESDSSDDGLIYHDEEDDTERHFSDHILTTEYNGRIVDIGANLSARFFKIPISKQIKTDPGTILTFKFEVRKIRDSSERRNSDFLKSILRSKEFYDMEIRSADGRSSKAHKLILSIVSPVIKARFVHDGNDDVFKTNFEFRSLKSWLDHIYRRNWIDDETKLNTVMNVFMIADFFGTQDVSKHCCDVIIHRLSPIILSRVVQHDMIYLAGDQAKDVQDAIFNLIDKQGLGEIEGMDPDNPRIASFMAKISERTKKRNAEEEL